MDRRDELIVWAWETEVLGRAFFEAMVELRPDDRRLWELWAALETTTEGLVSSVAASHGIEIDRAAVSAAGAEFARAAAGQDRAELLRGTMAVAAEGIPRYEELGPLLDEDEAWLASELVAHERAFAAHAEAELAGTSGAEAAVVGYLTRHGTAVPVTG